ncbi:Cupredoxin [Jimgerdemannia flammicorona]|uniref:Cupredoxin n=2 Tax=Jimgerdemannia flammicorona TaxID=994334 RepID=A0A433QI81_9FUNG|nr:Cupredoxin [Jimgerdemannia flammicorona]
MIWNTQILAVSIVLLGGVSPSLAASRSYDFTVSKFAAAPDGFNVNVLGANRQLNVPIIVNKGDTISVKTTNNLDEPTALHFHGIFQNGTNWYDGAAMVTQCPIQPNKTLTYTFKVDKQHGTYWWHSHHKSQYIQGLRGPLIVKDPANEPYTKDYDQEIIVSLADWYHTDKNILLSQLFAPGGNGDEPMPDSGLINGKGQYDCTQSNPVVGTQRAKNACVSNSTLEVFNVQQSKRYRFRIINMSAMAVFNFTIDGHRLDVIEADGTDTQKVTVDTIRIGPAQRYSVIVTMNQTAQDYWVRAVIDTTQWMQNFTSTFNPETRAILHYGTAGTAKTPTTQPPSQATLLNPYSLLPYSYPPPPANFDLGVSMRFDMLNDEVTNINYAFVTIDNVYDTVHYEMPKRPTLFDVLDGNNLPNSTLAINVAKNAVVELTIWNDDVTEHYFHLHGHQFWVMGSGQALNNVIKPGPTQNFPVRDTIAVPGCRKRANNTGEGICGGGLGYVRVRFIADNPGVWLLHCHMEWHMAAGLAATFVVDADGLRATRGSLPAAIRNTCNV